MRRLLILLTAPFTIAACATAGPQTAASGASASADEAFLERPEFRLSQIEASEAADLDALLGAPDLARVEGMGEFRRYTLSSCALLVILYPDETGVRRVRNVESGALKSGAEKPDLTLCLARGKSKIS